MQPTFSLRRFGSILTRAEEWGGMVLDEKHDRIWAFSRDHFQTLIDSLESGNSIIPRDLPYGQQLRAFLDNFAPWESREVNPYRRTGSFFVGPFPDTEGFQLTAPISLSWALTNQCQSACVYCCSDSHINSHPGLKTSEVLRIVDKVAEWQVLRLIIGGGEPTIRDDLGQILQYAAHRGIRPTLASNGTRFDSFDIGLLKETIMFAQLSLDTLDEEVHRRLRPHQGSVAQVQSVIALLHGANIPVRVVTVLTCFNERYLETIASYLASTSVEQWFLFLIQPSGRGRYIYDEYRPREPEQILERLAGIAETYSDLSVSYWGTERTDQAAIYLTSYGDLELFDYGTGVAKHLANLGKCGIEELTATWNSVPAELKRDTLINFTTANRNPCSIVNE